MHKDPIVLMMKLQQKYKEYGAVKIKACPEWQPPLCFKYTEKGITTRIQKIHRLSQGKVIFWIFGFSLGKFTIFSLIYNIGLSLKILRVQYKNLYIHGIRFSKKL